MFLNCDNILSEQVGKTCVFCNATLDNYLRGYDPLDQKRDVFISYHTSTAINIVNELGEKSEQMRVKAYDIIKAIGMESVFENPVKLNIL